MMYFDNAATTFPKPEKLYEDIINIYSSIGVNSTRGKYVQADKMNEVLKKLRKNLSEIFDINESKKIILNSSATISLNQIIQGLDYSQIETVYISPFEHNAVWRTILEMKKQKKFEIKILPFDKFIWSESKTKLSFQSKKPDLIILTHASNVFGNILPIYKIFKLGKEYNSINVLDASQTSGLIEFNKLNTNLLDFIVFSGHKSLYGPSGIGGFVYNSEIKLKPLIFGGTGINSEEEEMPKTIPERFEVGSLNSLGIIGLKISTDWILEKGINEIFKKEEENRERLKRILLQYDDIEIFDYKKSVGIISITIKNYSTGEIRDILNEYNIAIRSGLHCSPLAHAHLKTQSGGTIRFSVGYFNTEKDFEKLDEILEEVL